MSSTLWRLSRLVRRPPSGGAITRLQSGYAETRSNNSFTIINTGATVTPIQTVVSPTRMSEWPSPSSARVRHSHHSVGTKEPVTETKLENVTEEQLQVLARRLARGAQAGDVVLLLGDLGAGKSTFARAFIREIVGDEKLSVTSPTFVIEQIYAGTDNRSVHHMDLYRLDGPKEIQELGLQHNFVTGICLVEWPDRLGRFVPSRRLDVEVKYSTADDSLRDVKLRAVGDAWAARVAAAIQLAPAFTVVPNAGIAAAVAVAATTPATSPLAVSPLTAALTAFALHTTAGTMSVSAAAATTTTTTTRSVTTPVVQALELPTTAAAAAVAATAASTMNEAAAAGAVSLSVEIGDGVGERMALGDLLAALALQRGS